MTTFDVLEIALAAGAMASGLAPRTSERAAIEAMNYVEPEPATSMRGWRWRPEEVQFLRDNLGYLTYAEIGAYLGRTEVAVHNHRKRLGLPAVYTVRRRNDELTTSEVAEAMGTTHQTASIWILEGLLPGRELPLDATIRVVRYQDLVRFAVNPLNWPYFIRVIQNTGRINDPYLRRLIELRKERWGDEWLSSGQIEREFGSSEHYGRIRKYLLRENLPRHLMMKYSRWYVRRSVVEGYSWPAGKGSTTLLDVYSPQSDCFVILCMALGFSLAMTSHLMQWPKTRPAHRLEYIVAEVPHLIAEHNLPVERLPDGRLFADWRDCVDRFPALARAIERFKAGRKLSDVDSYYLQATLRTWARRYAETPEQKRFARFMQSGWRKINIRGIRRNRRKFKKLFDGIDPFA